MRGRVRSTARFIALTNYGGRDEAETVLARVRQIHDRVRSSLPGETLSAANDPALLAWAYVTKAFCYPAA